MLTINRLKEMLSYDPETGLFTRLKGVKGAAAGEIAGHVRKTGYVVISLDHVEYLAHRLAWFYMTGEWPSKTVDHKNCAPADNRWDNLREATQTEQNANMGRRKDNLSGVRGVSWSERPRGWRARICVDGKQTLLGTFESIDDAKWVYEAAARKYFGEFVRSQ